MPIYTYRCEKCEKVQDVLRKIQESDIPLACDCTGTMRKTFDQSGTTFVLKGDGWFKTRPTENN